MTWIDVSGWAAAVFTLAAFSMKTMLPLRLAAILSNACFIVYGYFAGFYPAFVLHLILLPFNIWRIAELFHTLKQMQNTRHDGLKTEWIASLMKPRRMKKGDVVFNKGDRADYLYYLSKGTVRLVEIDKTLPPGTIFGEVAFFNDGKSRTLSVECETNCEIMAMNEKDLMALYYQKPEFGFFLVKLLAERVSEYAEQAVKTETDPVEK